MTQSGHQRQPHTDCLEVVLIVTAVAAAIRKVRKRRARTKEDTMNLKQLFVAVPAALFIIGNSVAIAGQTVDVAGTIA